MTAALSGEFAITLAADIHPDLIALHSAIQAGWEPPDVLTEDEYAALRHAPVSPLRGFAGFGASFGGKWFGGYARNRRGDDYVGAAKRGLRARAGRLGAVHYVCASYDRAWVERDAVVYCDPPYAGTTGYKDAFCPVTFWHKADAWAACGAQVFVSEYKAPPHWTPVWEETRTRDMRSDLLTAAKVTERLFVPRAQA